MAREQQAHGQRVGAHDAESRTRAAVDLGPGTQQDGQPLARIVTSDEDDRVLAVRRVRLGRHEHAVRDDVVGARKPARDRRPRLVGDRDAVVDAVDEEAPDRQAHAVPVELSRRMPRRHDRTLRRSERGHADPRRHRLVQVEDVEALLRERPPQTTRHPRREHDVRQRAVRGHDHRSPHGNDVVRRLTVPPVPRVQRPRERPRRVVADDRPRLDAQLAERLRLELRMLVDGSPERPGEGHDDADLHAAILRTWRSRLGGWTSRRASPSCTRTWAARSPPRSCGASHTSRASPCP